MGLVLTGASCNRGNNSDSVWTKKPGDYLQKKSVKGHMLQQKAATSLVFKKRYEHFFCLRDLHVNQNSLFLLTFVRKKKLYQRRLVQ